MRKRRALSAALAAAVSLVALCGPGESRAQSHVAGGDRSASAVSLPDSVIQQTNFTRTAVEIVGLNTLVWSYDRFVRSGGGDGFRVGFDSWGDNIKNGFEWDDNNFSTNQFAHPYHGSLYFNAARSNGYTFWESAPFAFAGSFLWEYFGETHHPSMNDWIATSVGGSALGEMLNRFSVMVRDNTATGGERTRREIGGLLINPMGGLNRALDGDWSRVHANPPDRFANSYYSLLNVGARTVGEGSFGESDSTRGFVEVDFHYGDPFTGDMDAPYDHFNLALQLNFSDRNTLGLVRSEGLLKGFELRNDDAAGHILGINHRFDLVNNSKVEFGSQSMGVGLLSRWNDVLGFNVRTGVGLNAIILAGVSSDYANFTGRDYDYGPGAAARLWASVSRRGFTYLYLTQEGAWVHVVNGNKANHTLAASRISANVPVWKGAGVGATYLLILADRRYDAYPEVHVRFPETRLYGVIGLN